MLGFPRSNARNETISRCRARGGNTAGVPFAQRAGQAVPGRRPSAEDAMSCDDGAIWSRSASCAAVTGGRRSGRQPGEHIPRSIEPSAWLPRIRVAGRFVHADVAVIGCIRFRTETSCRTMDREASTKGTAVPGFSGAGTCGGVMVRGPKSGNGTRSSVYYLDSAGLASPRPRPRALDTEWDPLVADMQADGSLAARPGIGGSWRGAGGRWLLWPLRVVLWTALVVVAFRGITAIIFGSSPAPAGGTGAANATGEFPVSLAEAYATEFGRVYLGFSPQSLGQREQALAAFVPPGVSAANPSLGWNGIGQLNLQSLQVAGIRVQDPQHAVVTLLALLNGQLMELGVPVAATGSGLVVTGEPAWLPAPRRISPPPAPRGSDPVAQGQLMNELPAFFRAYASGDSGALNGFLAHGASVAGLGGAVTFDSIGALHVPPGGASRQITVTVIWQVPVTEQPGSTAGNLGMASKLEMTYGMSVVDLQSGKWYVKEIGASTEAVGAR
jgi:hypothetical protein